MPRPARLGHLPWTHYQRRVALAAIVIFGCLVAALNQTLAFGPLLVGQISLSLGYPAVFVFVGACGAVVAVAVPALAPRRSEEPVPVTRPSRR